MKQVNVLAQSFDRKTGKETAPARVEEIYINHANVVFRDCKTIIDIKNRYEQFWNDLNKQSKEIVFVQRIDIIS